MRGEKTEKECIRESSVQNCACSGHWKRERERERERERHAHRWLPNFAFSLLQGGRILRFLDLYRDSEEAARVLGVPC